MYHAHKILREEIKRETMADQKKSHLHGGGRVVFFPFPFQGHITPMFQLAAFLHRRGFSITILHTTSNYPDTTRNPDFRFVPIPDGLTKHQTSGGDVVANIMALNANCAARFCDWFVAEEEGIDCVITDAYMYAVQAEAEQMGLRTLVLRTGSAECCNVFFAFPMLWEKGYLPIQDSQLEDPVIELPPLRVKDIPQLGPIGSSSQETFAQLQSLITGGIRAASGLILNTFDALEGSETDTTQKQASVPVFSVGPLHFSPHAPSSLLPQDHSCMEWLDQQAPDSVVYVSFGSLASMDLDELIETAWGLSDSGRPFLWVIRPNAVRGSNVRPELPSEFREETRGRGKVIEWAPQQAVLGHPAVGAFWTHCGWNSTMESVSEGVPMLCRPGFGDQMMNARFVCEVWKVGVMAGNDMERGKTCEAIRGLMGERGREMRGRAKILKESSKRCMEIGGSSVKAFDKLVEHILSP